MIIIQPSGGLCNRMRVINSGWKLARERKEKLQILWNCNAELNCPFESLFQPVTEFKITSIHSVADPRKLFHQKTAKNYLTNETILAHRNSDGCLDPDYVASLTGKTYIFTWEWFYPSEDYHLFVPTERLQKRIDEHHFPLWLFLRGRAHPPHRQPARHRQKLHGCLYPFHEAGTGG